MPENGLRSLAPHRNEMCRREWWSTVGQLIKRSGRLEVKLALEIATQAAAGLAAVHKQKLVHRDIKPSNIMVSIEEGAL